MKFSVGKLGVCISRVKIPYKNFTKCLRAEYSGRLKESIKNYLREIGSGMSNAIIQLMIETYRGHNCTSHSNDVSP